jgi:thiamine transport system permease protein
VVGRRSLTLALAALPLAFLGVFFLWPVASILVRGLAPNGALDLAVPLQVLARPATRDVAWFTLWQAVVSTLLTLAIGLPGAYVLARFDVPGRRLINALTLVPFVLPTVVVGAAFLA